MEDLHSVLDEYQPSGDGEAADVERLRQLLRVGDPWSRAGPLHVTASALVIDPRGRRVLLRWHARMQRWLQVGGHGDPDETDPWLVALREAREETGLDDLAALTPELERRPVQIVVVPVPASTDEAAHEHADIRYVLATTAPERLRAESSDAAVRWLSFDDARDAITEPNLHELVARVERLIS